VVDVEAGIGDFALFAAQVDNTRILAFESFPESFALLSENLILNEVSNV
jgi:FkbM family methyltransferase